MTPDAYLSYLHSAFGVVAVRLVHLGVWGNAPCPACHAQQARRCAHGFTSAPAAWSVRGL